MRRLVITEPLLREALRAVRREPWGILALRVGIGRRREEEDLLVRGFRPLPLDPVRWDLRSEEQALLTWAPNPTTLPRRSLPSGLPCWALTSVPGGMIVRGLKTIRVIGPGMPQWPEESSPALEERLAERWHRTRGALGEQAWRRLIGLRYGIVGCGRLGSLIAEALAALGARHLVLIDPDSLETTNLGEMAALPGAIPGQPKAEALARALASGYPWVRARALPDSIATWRALEALKECDVLIGAVDRDAARLALGVIAALYLKPMIDIGTGVGLAGAPGRMGADVRLILPGDSCLLCSGGLAEPEHARRALAAGRELELPPGSRAGSLRSLNMIATGLALRLWEDLIAGALRESTWMQVVFDRRGPFMSRMPGSSRAKCPLCAWRGAGDAGRIPILQQILRLPGIPGKQLAAGVPSTTI